MSAAFPGVDRVLSRVPIDRTGTVYRSCDVLMKLSRVEGMYSPPLEMFHCGGTVVTYDVTGHEGVRRPTTSTVLVVPMEQTQGAVVPAIRKLKENPDTAASSLKPAALTDGRSDGPMLGHRLRSEFWSIVRLIARRPPRTSSLAMLAIRWRRYHR